MKINNKYNVMLITVDSLRANFLGCYNEELRAEKISPEIDNFARESLLFSHAISQSSHTSPAFLALLSGNYPSKYGDWFDRISDHRLMVQEILKGKGYYTYAFNSNPYISKYYGYDRGFDVFEDNLPQFKQNKLGRQLMFQLGKVKMFTEEPYENAREINSQVAKCLENIKLPYFMWVHYMDVHGPYVSKRGWALKNRISANFLWRKVLKSPEKVTDRERQMLIETYKEEIRYLDHYIAELLSYVTDDTLIIFTSDHGDLFGEHNLYGHTLKLYNGLLHVPLLIRMPKTFPFKNRCINTHVRSIDLVPTILDILSFDNTGSFYGSSYLPLILGKHNVYQCEYIVSEVGRKHICVQKGEWKLIVDYRISKKELYNVMSDSNEERNLIENNKKIADELEMIIKEHIHNNKRTRSESKTVVEDEEIKARLEALGYMDK